MSGPDSVFFRSPAFKRQKVDQSYCLEEKQIAAFQRERERKAGSAKAYEVKEEAVGEFLKYVIVGEQDKAETLLKERPELALKKGTVTDLSKREFKSITGFQYALWALDWRMWKMLLKYLPKEIAALQLAELEEKGTAHGKHFDLAPLIEAINRYVKNYDAWYNVKAWDKMLAYWQKEVGGHQLLLPVHVVHEYCHPDRSFIPCPEFKEKNIPRSMKLHEAQASWFTCVYNEGRLGEKFAIVRCDLGIGAIGRDNGGPVTIADAEALQRLWKVRHQQLEGLRIKLHYIMEVKELLNDYFPSVLSSTVMGYF